MKYNVSRSEAKRLGIERVPIGGSSSDSSGYKQIGNTSSEITPDAEKAMGKLSDEAQTYILDQNFGGTLREDEVEKYNNKWIEADAINESQGSALLSGMLPEHMQNKTIANLSPENFKTLVPSLMPGTPEYEEAMEKLSTAYFDVMQQQMDAQTEQEKSAADYNWKTLKNTIESNLNITLSEDAFAAWDQIQSVTGQMGEQGLSGSGMEAESIDSYLNKTRRADALARKESLSKEDQSNMEYFTSFATPDQIKELIATNPSKAAEYGLIPSDEIKNSMTPTALKAKYPTMSDDDINRAIASVVDENGNYRSNLYQKHMVGSDVGANQGNVDTNNIVYDQYGNPTAIPVKPSDYGKLDIDRAKDLYQAQNTPLVAQKANYEALRKLGAIQPTEGTSSATASGTQFDKTGTPDSNAEALADSAAKISESLSKESDSSSSKKSSSGNDRGGLSVREYKAKQAGGTLDYKTGQIRLPDGSLL